MAIATSVDSSYFVLDVPDVRWTDADAGRNIKITITPENGEPAEFTEGYVPDADHAVTLRGLSELLQPYVKPCPTPLRQDLLITSGVWLATVTRALWTAQLYTSPTDGSAPEPVGGPFQSYAYYASQRTDTRPGNAAFWLTRYIERTIQPEQPLVLSAFLTGNLTARVRVTYLSEGVLAQTTFAPSLGEGAAIPPSFAAVLHYTLDGIAAAADVDAGSIKIVTFELVRDDSVLDSVTFHIERKHRTQLRIVAFTNCFGMLETEAITGADERTTEMEAEFAWVDRQYEKTTQDEVTAERLAARHMTKQQRDSLRDLAASPEVYLIHENGAECFERMTVTALEMTDRLPHTAPQTAYITLRRSHRHQEVVTRCGDTDPDSTRSRIFDYTFDKSFN